MTVFSRGYAGLPFSETEEAFSLFTENIDLLTINEQKILATAEYFFCELPFASCSWPYVGGDGLLCLGFLLLGWRNGIFVEPCPDCKNGCLTFTFAGSPLSGSNNWSGFCTQCRKRQSNRDTVHKPFLSKVLFVIQLRKQYPQYVKQWEEYNGVKFSFGGDGLTPSIKKRLKTIKLFDSIKLSEVIREIFEGVERSEDSPGGGYTGEAPLLKFSR